MSHETVDFQAAKELLASYSMMAQQSDEWVHSKSGGVYTIIGLGLDEPMLTPVVFYEGKAGGPAWVRQAFEFFDRFEARE